LQISLIEAHQLKIKNSIFDVVPIFREMETSFINQNEKDLEISFVNPNAVESLILDSDVIRFRQVISNLINNAMKFTKVGHVRFGFEVGENEVVFYCEDTGIGIKEKEQIKVFNHFHKIEDNSNILYGGSGLGLSISKNLVGLMNGRIWLTSEHGKGTTFYFTLPYDPEIQNQISV
jgi:signal transduction histidine kinase